ncbi:hypothetical protein BJ999_006090 [Actinomadura citrea]|uniref:Secreted protein n=1 Tax=Actinomadura citrea TaxID=46158 RepID=A0A7Y9GG61_9ACTN|nr:hypothetical protein [Actinomadura citrea]GGT67189.1 hypothetical protein GCM10010177_25690 [Actinomadura citrea]
MRRAQKFITIPALTTSAMLGLLQSPASAEVSYFISGESDNVATSAGADYSYSPIRSSCSGTAYEATFGPGTITDNLRNDSYGGAVVARWEYCDNSGTWRTRQQWGLVVYEAGYNHLSYSRFTFGHDNDPVLGYPVRNLHFYVCNVGPTGNIGTCGDQMHKVP